MPSSKILASAGALSLLLLAAAQGGGPGSFDRAAAVARIEARLAEYQAWSAQSNPLYPRENAVESEYLGEARVVNAANGYLAALDYSAGMKLPNVEITKVAGAIIPS